MIMEKIQEYRNNETIAFQYKEQKVSFKQLYQILASNQKFLIERGYNNKDVFYIKAENQFEFVLCLLSIFSIGCFIVPIHKAVSETELEKIISLTGAVCLNDEEIKKCTLIKQRSDYELKIPDANKYGVYQLTSGSTGIPKMCIRTGYNFFSEATSFIQTYSLSEKEKALSICPLEHSFAFGAALMTALVRGFTLHIIDEFKPRSVLKYIDKNEISLLYMVPAMARMFCLTIPQGKNLNLEYLRIPLVGAGAITEILFNDFKEKFGIYLLSNMGSTETGAVISRIDPFNYKTVGKAMSGVSLKLCNEQGEIIPDGNVGNLYIKSKGMFHGYLNQNTDFDEDGYFSMGDMAVRDEKGNIYMKGRRHTLINIGGKKVNPIETEKIILEIQGVEDCKVFSVKLKSGEEVIKANIVCKNVTKQDIFMYLKSNLSDYKIPSMIEFVLLIERDVMGKVKKN